MSEQTKPQSGAVSVAKRIDEIAASAVGLFGHTDGSFEAELAVAQAIIDLRTILTPAVMAPVMGLMNTDLGFRTDRDPNVTPADKEGRPTRPYPVEVVRECFIESKLRGFHAVGNEWNIIAGRFYGCKNGLKRKCEQFPGLTALKILIGVPRLSGDKGAIVPAKASWMIGGVADSIEAEIPVRVNAYMGSDAIIGKTERKIYKRIYDRISGIQTPEGDVEEVVAPTAASEPEKNKPAEDNSNPDLGPTSQPAAGNPAQQQADSPQAQLARLAEESKLTFDAYQKWGVAQGTDPEAVSRADWSEIPADMARRWLRAKEGFVAGVRKFGKGAQ